MSPYWLWILLPIVDILSVIEDIYEEEAMLTVLDILYS